MLENLSVKLKSARLNCKLSRKQVAELTGLTASAIGSYETGEHLPSLPVLVKLATHYKVSVDYLLDFDMKDRNVLSLDGLTNEETNVLKAAANCFRKK